MILIHIIHKDKIITTSRKVESFVLLSSEKNVILLPSQPGHSGNVPHWASVVIAIM